MNKHEIFAKVKAHLLKQRVRAMSQNAPLMCAYRDGYGRSCAVGCLIPDENYVSFIENLPASSNEVLNRLPFDVTQEEVDLLTSLQMVHDRTSPEDWEDQLAAIAIQFKIKEPS